MDLEDLLATDLIGRAHDDAAIEASGSSNAESRTSGRLVAASTMTPSLPVNPSISVRIWLNVCSRSSWPPRPDELPRSGRWHRVRR